MNQKNMLALALLGTGAFIIIREMNKKPINVPADIYSDGMIAGFSSGAIVDSVLPWINLNPSLKPLVGMAAKQFLSGLMGENTIDAQWHRAE